MLKQEDPHSHAYDWQNAYQGCNDQLHREYAVYLPYKPEAVLIRPALGPFLILYQLFFVRILVVMLLLLRGMRLIVLIWNTSELIFFLVTRVVSTRLLLLLPLLVLRVPLRVSILTWVHHIET